MNYMAPMLSTRQVETIVDGLDHPECLCFGTDGAGYAGSEDGRLFRFTMSGNKTVVGSVDGGSIGGICVDANNVVYDCDYGTLKVHAIRPDRTVREFSTGTSMRPMRYPNYPVFGHDGQMYISDSGDFYRANSTIYMVDGGETTQAATDGYHFLNGLAIDGEGRWLYAIESSASCVLRFPIQGKSLGEAEVFVHLPGCVPDGLAFAESGHVYVACYAPDVIFRVSPAGLATTLLFDPVADKLNRPTNVAFYPNSTLLCFSNLGGFTVNVVDVGEHGLPLNYPNIGGGNR